MRCERFLELYDGLEPGSPLGPAMRRHLGSCPSCRAELARFERAFEDLKRVEAVPRGRDEALLEDRVLRALLLMPRPRRELSFAQWAVPLLLVASSCVILPLFARFHGAADDAVFLPLAIVFGIGLSVFGSVYVGSHAVELKAEFDRRRAAFAGTGR